LLSTGSGKIVIPGGKYKNDVAGGQGSYDDDDDDDDNDDKAEWKRNGVGRVDVRGFRELKI
jgi:OTU domain-containing protein 3